MLTVICTVNLNEIRVLLNIKVLYGVNMFIFTVKLKYTPCGRILAAAILDCSVGKHLAGDSRYAESGSETSNDRMSRGTVTLSTEIPLFKFASRESKYNFMR